MALTQTDIDNLGNQFQTIKELNKTNFVAAVVAAKTPGDLVKAADDFKDAFSGLQLLDDFMDDEQELIDASSNGTDDDSTSDNSDVATPASDAPSTAQPETPTSATPASEPASTSAPVQSTQATAAQDIINQATTIVQNNPALLQDIVNVVGTVKENPELLTKVASALSNGDQNLITQGLNEVKQLLASKPA